MAPTGWDRPPARKSAHAAINTSVCENARKGGTGRTPLPAASS